MKHHAVVLTAMLAVICSLASLAAAQAAVSEVRGPIWISVPSSAGALQSIQVKAPANGNLMVTVTGTLVYEHTQGTQGDYCLQLSQTSGDTSGCVPDEGSDSAIRSFISSEIPSTVSGMGASEQYSIVRTYSVTRGTTYTLYLNGYQGGFNGAWLFQPAMTALFLPGTLAQ